MTGLSRAVKDIDLGYDFLVERMIFGNLYLLVSVIISFYVVLRCDFCVFLSNLDFDGLRGRGLEIYFDLDLVWILDLTLEFSNYVVIHFVFLG